MKMDPSALAYKLVKVLHAVLRVKHKPAMLKNAVYIEQC